MLQNERAKIPDLMMKKINDYIKKNPLPYLDDIPDFYVKMEEIRKIRNDASHGNEVSYDDFLTVKEFVISRQAIEFISWAKIYFEDNKGFTDFNN